MANIVITGAGRGIGLELARAYTVAGHNVFATVRKAKGFERGEIGTIIEGVEVSDAASVATLATRLAGQPVDLLINNAGVIGPDRQSSLDMDFEGFLHALQINTLGPLRVTQALLPNLRLASAARVAVISSNMGAMANSGSDRVAYRTSKAAINKVVQCLAADLKAEGIAVAALHPGWVQTEMGGEHAAIAPTESAAGIKAVLEGLNIDNSGRFWNYDGQTLNW